MAKLKIENNLLKGSVKIPPSKSMAHRGIICASLAAGKSKIENIDYSDDIIATINGMRAIGAEIEQYDDYVIIEGIAGKKDSSEERLIDCNESGSTLRFLIPISLLVKGSKTFIGRGNLGKRPLNPYYEIFDQDGVSYSYEDDVLNLKVEGELKGGEYHVKGNVSSQFISGLLFTLPLLKHDSKLIITTEMESKGYIDLTLAAIRKFGIEIINNNYQEFIIRGNQQYTAGQYRVEGDYSQAAFYLVADAIGSNVAVNDVLLDSAQGDKEVLDILERMGVEFTTDNNSITAKAPEKLKNTIIDAAQCPDIIPVLSVAASLAQGTTEIINAERLRIKECDRLKAVATELAKLGADIKEKEDGLIINGVSQLEGGTEVWSWQDHRIAMTLAIAATKCKKPVIIKDCECVSKSYPKFYEDFNSLGGVSYEWNMGE